MNPELTPRPSIPTDPATPSSETSRGTYQPPTSPPNLPYTITRTYPGQQLPVYNLSKGGGTKHLTRIRKLSGNLEALKADLTKALGLEGGMTNRRGENVEGMSVNLLTKQISVRGWRAPEIKAWAERQGF
jgi:large subunit ribosomal protein L49